MGKSGRDISYLSFRIVVGKTLQSILFFFETFLSNSKNSFKLYNHFHSLLLLVIQLPFWFGDCYNDYVWDPYNSEFFSSGYSPICCSTQLKNKTWRMFPLLFDHNEDTPQRCLTLYLFCRFSDWTIVLIGIECCIFELDLFSLSVSVV